MGMQVTQHCNFSVQESLESISRKLTFTSALSKHGFSYHLYSQTHKHKLEAREIIDFATQICTMKVFSPRPNSPISYAFSQNQIPSVPIAYQSLKPSQASVMISSLSLNTVLIPQPKIAAHRIQAGIQTSQGPEADACLRRY